MEIKVLGAGCAKCSAAYQLIKRIIEKYGIDAQLSKVEDIVEILNAGILSTPAIMIDGAVKIKGRIPSEKEIKQLLGI